MEQTVYDGATQLSDPDNFMDLVDDKLNQMMGHPSPQEKNRKLKHMFKHSVHYNHGEERHYPQKFSMIDYEGFKKTMQDLNLTPGVPEGILEQVFYDLTRRFPPNGAEDADNSTVIDYV